MDADGVVTDEEVVRLITLGYAVILFAVGSAPDGMNIYGLSSSFQSYVSTGQDPTAT